jgi:hypothetical protein
MEVTYLYSNGLPFGDDIKINLDRQIERVKSNLASLIIITGGLGSGKTTAGIHCIDYINKQFGLPPLDLTKPRKEIIQYAYRGEEFKEKLTECYEQRLPVLLYDEAGDYNKKAALTSFNRAMNNCFDTFRAFKVIVIMALPNFAVTDSDLFDKEVPRMLLKLHREKGRSSSDVAAYGLFEMNLLRMILKKKDLKSLYAYRNIYPNFRDHFKNLTPDRAALLDKVVTKEKVKDQKRQVVQERGLLNYDQLSQKLGCSRNYIVQQVSKYKIKMATKLGKSCYFDKEVVDTLRERMRQ